MIASMYAVYHGPDGLRRIARRTHEHAATLAAGLRAAGVALASDAFFDTVTAMVPGRARAYDRREPSATASTCTRSTRPGSDVLRRDDDRRACRPCWPRSA